MIFNTGEFNLKIYNHGYNDAIANKQKALFAIIDEIGRYVETTESVETVVILVELMEFVTAELRKGGEE